MSDLNEIREEVIRKIELEFPKKLKMKTPQRFKVSHRWDSVGDEHMEIRDALEGKSWDKVTDFETLKKFYTILEYTETFLGFHYYLPAFLIAGVRNPEYVWRETPFFHSLYHSAKRYPIDQLEAVIEWLKFLLSYWNEALKGRQLWHWDSEFLKERQTEIADLENILETRKSTS